MEIIDKLINYFTNYKIITTDYNIIINKNAYKCTDFTSQYPNLYEYAKTLSNLKKDNLLTAIKIFDDHYQNYEQLAYSNLKNVKVVKNLSKVKGSYLFTNDTNMLKYHNDSVNTFFHELLHLSTSTINRNTWFCGLSQTNLKTVETVGEGITEGYTELLTNRYCPHNIDKNSKMVYNDNVKFAQLLETALGKNFLEACYFNADLYSLKQKITTLTSEDDAIYFLRSMDTILNDDYSSYEPKIEIITKCQRILERICILSSNDIIDFNKQKFIIETNKTNQSNHK